MIAQEDAKQSLPNNTHDDAFETWIFSHETSSLEVPFLNVHLGPALESALKPVPSLIDWNNHRSRMIAASICELNSAFNQLEFIASWQIIAPGWWEIQGDSRLLLEKSKITSWQEDSLRVG